MEFNSSYVRPRRSLLKHVHGQDLRVLDVGCANGANGQYLIKNASISSIIGIEYDASMAAEAKKSYNHVFVGDLDNMDISSLLDSERFDYIILGDILEHLKNPWRVLKEMSLFLKPNGKVILSMPNVQHIDVFIHVFVKGVWPHNERGIFDKTHLRFFTQKTIRKLILSAGLVPTSMQRAYRLRDRKGSKFKYSPIEWMLKYLFRNLYTFQYIFICERDKVE